MSSAAVILFLSTPPPADADRLLPRVGVPWRELGAGVGRHGELIARGAVVKKEEVGVAEHRRGDSTRATGVAARFIIASSSRLLITFTADEDAVC